MLLVGRLSDAHVNSDGSSVNIHPRGCSWRITNSGVGLGVSHVIHPLFWEAERHLVGSKSSLVRLAAHGQKDLNVIFYNKKLQPGFLYYVYLPNASSVTSKLWMESNLTRYHDMSIVKYNVKIF